MRRLITSVISIGTLMAGTALAISTPTSVMTKKIVAQEMLNDARIEYSKKAYANAVRIYMSIPKGTQEYINSREELGWAYLQTGDWSSLRGLLAHLNTPTIPIENRLEGRVLASISALHSCDFASVKKNIADFQSDLRPFAESIDKQLQNLKNTKSPQAVVLQNKKTLVLEAITKMRFVKIELLSQLQRLERYKTKSDVLAKTNQVASSDERTNLFAIETAENEKSKMVFRADGDYWPDELFNLKSLSKSDCDNFQESTKAHSEKGKL